MQQQQQLLQQQQREYRFNSEIRKACGCCCHRRQHNSKKYYDTRFRGYQETTKRRRSQWSHNQERKDMRNHRQRRCDRVHLTKWPHTLGSDNEQDHRPHSGSEERHAHIRTSDDTSQGSQSESDYQSSGSHCKVQRKRKFLPRSLPEKSKDNEDQQQRHLYIHPRDRISSSNDEAGGQELLNKSDEVVQRF